MTQEKVVHFLGEIIGLGEETLTRVLLNHNNCTIPKKYFHSSIEKLSASLEFVKHRPQIHTESSVAKHDVVVFFHFGDGGIDTSLLVSYPCFVILVSDNPSVIGPLDESIKLLHIHDMIHYVANKQYNTKLDDLLELCLKGHPLDIDSQSNLHWWVSQQDVAACLIRLIHNAEKLPQISDLCGRRGWSSKETLEQLQLLYQRTLAGASGKFNPEHLVVKPVVTKILQGSELNIRSSRPDLSVIDDVLLAADGQRWRPLITLRTSLMHYLATKDLHHNV
ncbi:MAG TPA: hypothetical protein HA327_06590 [Candidatus Poseidoniaceae archaeon]|nr:hypothetical protein [Candidatus Poseidoniaceae archaeon]